MSSYHYSFIFSHRFHCLGVSPTDFTLAGDVLPQIAQIYTELLAEVILPQISQIYTEVRLPSRGCTCLRSALPLARARSAPTEQLVHQPSNVDIHLTTLVHLRQVHPLKTASVKIREICGRLFYARSFCEFCGFRGRSYSARSAIRGKPFHARILTRNSKGR